MTATVPSIAWLMQECQDFVDSCSNGPGCEPCQSRHHTLAVLRTARPLLEELQLRDDVDCAREDHRGRLPRDQRATLDALLAEGGGG